MMTEKQHLPTTTETGPRTGMYDETQSVIAIEGEPVITDAPAPEPCDRSTLQLLIIEPEPGPLSALTEQLTALGCAVSVVQDWRSSLRAFQQIDYDVVLADKSSANADGIDLCQRLHRLERHVHVILVLDADDKVGKRSALEAGVDDVLSTPLEPFDVELSIASARRVICMQRRLFDQNQQLETARAQIDSQLQSVSASLKAAAIMQRGLLPAPIRDGRFRLETLFVPSQELGGDVLGAQMLANGKLLFFNLDVAGHGVPAALEAFALHSRLAFPPPDTPERLQLVANRLNAELLSREGNSATLVLGLLDSDGMGVTLLRAGHPPPLLVPKYGEPRFFELGGLPLGMFEDPAQQLVSLGLSVGDRLLIYSDGLIDGDGEEHGLGRDGLVNFWSKRRELALALAIAQFEEEVRRVNDASPLVDDLSLLVIERC